MSEQLRSLLQKQLPWQHLVSWKDTELGTHSAWADATHNHLPVHCIVRKIGTEDMSQHDWTWTKEGVKWIFLRSTQNQP